MKSSKEYLREHGFFCPACDSEEITPAPKEVDGNSKVLCHDCDSTWTDEFKKGKLVGFINFEK